MADVTGLHVALTVQPFALHLSALNFTADLVSYRPLNESANPNIAAYFERLSCTLFLVFPQSA